MKSILCIIAIVVAVTSLTECAHLRQQKVPISLDLPANFNLFALKGINANTLFDTMLKKIKDQIQLRFDPYPVPEKTILDIIHVDLSIGGTSNVIRASDAELTFVSGKACLNVELMFYNLVAEAQLQVFLFPPGKAEIDIDVVKANVTASGPLTGPFNVTHFKTDNIDQVLVKLTDLPKLIEPLADSITDIMASFLKTEVAKLMHSQIKQIINDIMYQTSKALI